MRAHFASLFVLTLLILSLGFLTINASEPEDNPIPLDRTEPSVKPETSKPSLSTKSLKTNITQKGEANITNIKAWIVVDTASGTVVSEPGEFPKLAQPSQLRLRLMIKNEGKKDIYINRGSDMELLNLTLKGEGAKTLTPQLMMTMEMRMGKWHVIRAGEAFSVPVKQLLYGQRYQSVYSYMTTPGTYTLDYKLKIPMSMTQAGQRNPTLVTFHSNGIKIEAKEAVVKRVPVKLQPEALVKKHQLEAWIEYTDQNITIIDPENQDKNVPSQVNLKLVISTKSKKPIYLNEGSDLNKLSFILKGMGAKTELINTMFTEEFRMGSWIELSSKKPYTMKLTGLNHGHRMQEYQSYATSKGKYELYMTYSLPFRTDLNEASQTLSLAAGPISLNAVAVTQGKSAKNNPKNPAKPLVIIECGTGLQPQIPWNGPGQGLPVPINP